MSRACDIGKGTIFIISFYVPPVVAKIHQVCCTVVEDRQWKRRNSEVDIIEKIVARTMSKREY